MSQVVTLPDFSARDDEFVRKAVAQSNVVINLIGEERETPRFKFNEVCSKSPACQNTSCPATCSCIQPVDDICQAEKVLCCCWLKCDAFKSSSSELLKFCP